MYKIIDKQTKKVMGTYKDVKRARRRAEKLDIEYGAYRYMVEKVAE